MHLRHCFKDIGQQANMHSADTVLTVDAEQVLVRRLEHRPIVSCNPIACSIAVAEGFVLLLSRPACHLPLCTCSLQALDRFYVPIVAPKLSNEIIATTPHNYPEINNFSLFKRETKRVLLIMQGQGQFGTFGEQ